jgi:hypothetical protein
MEHRAIGVFKEVGSPLRPLLLMACAWTVVGACLWQGAAAHATTKPVSTLMPGQTLQYQIIGKAYVNSECYVYRVFPPTPLGDNPDAKIEFTGIGATKTVTIAPQQNVGQPLLTTCVDTAEGGSAFGFNVANESAVGGPRISVYGNSVNQNAYVATSLGATNCQNVSGELIQYTLSQAATFASDYQRGVPSSINPLIQCGSGVDSFVTSYTLEVTGVRSMKVTEYTYVDGSPEHYDIAQPACGLTSSTIARHSRQNQPRRADNTPIAQSRARIGINALFRRDRMIRSRYQAAQSASGMRSRCLPKTRGGREAPSRWRG